MFENKLKYFPKLICKKCLIFFWNFGVLVLLLPPEKKKKKKNARPINPTWLVHPPVKQVYLFIYFFCVA